MSKINRRKFLAIASALLPSFFFSKAAAATGFSLAKAATATPGVLLAKSSSIKVGQSQVYTGQDASGKTVEVILSRTKTGVVALDGTCTHQGCAVALQKTQLICPCHGSIFQASSGAVILGPNGAPKSSISPLAKYKVTEKSGNIYIR
jgi:Rieske Fe-S protein